VDVRASGASRAREGLTTVTRGTLVLLIGTLGYIVENFIARVLLVRVLSGADWSSFSLGLTASGFLAAFGSLGIGSAIARTLPYATTSEDRRQMIRTAAIVVTPAAAVVALLLVGFAQFSPNHGDTGLPITLAFLGVAASFSILCGLIAAIFQGFEDVSANAYFVQIINPLLFLLFLAAAYGVEGFHLSYLSALLAYVFAAALTLGALLIYTRVRLPRVLPAGPTPAGFSSKLLWFALPLFLVAVLSYLTQNADTLTLGYFHPSEVGQYTASLSLARLLQLGIASLGYIFLPVTTRFVRENDTEAVRITYTTATKWTVLTSLPFFLLFFFLPTRSMAFVYGSPYAIDALTLQIVVAGSFLSTLVGPSTQGQVAYGRTTLLLLNTLIAAVADIALALLLVPTYGLAGAAIAWAVANALLPLLSALELALLEGVHPFRPHYLVPLTLTVVPLGVLFLLVPLHLPFYALPILGLAIGALYGLVVWATGSIDDGDRMLLEVIETWIGRRIPVVHRIGSRRGRGVGRRPPERGEQ
jgi:O-antigen/teichoic acid export membrane protein